MKKSAIIFALIMSSISFANAQKSTPVVNEKQENQKDRINQGVRSGELTKKEGAQLRHNEAQIRKEERAYKADGVVTEAERKDLNKDLNRQSAAIDHQKHDAQKKPRARKH